MSQSGPSSLKKFFSKKVNEDKVEEEILSMVEEGYEQGVIEDNEAEMISNIFEFSDKNARDIMTARQKIIAMENTMTVEAALHFALENNYSRYPVFEEDLDSVLGVVHLKDLIAKFLKEPNAVVTEVLDDPIFIHPTFNISKLLEKMQSEKIHMAIVVDEYGQTEGIVAMEDIIEEIVGNIFDEHDEVQEEEISCLSEGVYIVDGSASLDELSDELDIEFPDEDIDTVNGFVLYKHGKLPSEDEEIDVIYKGYRFIPIEINDKMITSVRIEKIEEDTEKKDKE